jgi:hypothetical protein
MDVPHCGMNHSPAMVRLLAVYVRVKGTPDVVLEK